MYFGRDNPEHNYKIGTTELKKVTEEKDLGVPITNDAKASLQCTEAAKKQPKLWALFKNFFTFRLSKFLYFIQNLCEAAYGVCSTSLEPILKKIYRLFRENST